MSDDQAYLLDMLAAARQALGYMKGLDRKGFLDDPKTQDAVTRQLEILGEAAGRVSEEFRAGHPEIDWTGAIGLRNVLIHQYRRVDLDLVWDNVERELPAMAKALEPLTPQEES